MTFVMSQKRRKELAIKITIGAANVNGGRARMHEYVTWVLLHVKASYLFLEVFHALR